jgi:hypothetical protein
MKKINQSISANKLAIYGLTTAAMILFASLDSESAFAATTTAAAAKGTSSAAFDAAHSSVQGLVGGSLGKIVAGVSLAFGLIGCVLRFNPIAIAAPVGVAVAAGAGPAAIDTVLGALF